MSAEIVAHDARYALRGLLRTPLFTIVALLTLAIGSGANTAVFSVVDGVLLKPLPYPNPEQLVAVWHDAPGAPGVATITGGLRVSPSMLITYQEENRSFDHIGMWAPLAASVTGVAEPEQVDRISMMGDVLPALAVPPLLGRWLGAIDEDPAGPLRAMLSYGYWQQRFGGDPNIVGRTLTIDGVPAEIVGVMPEGFRVVDNPADVYTPLRFPRVGLAPPPFFGTGIARLKPGVTTEQANADLTRLLPIWLQRFPYREGQGPGVRAEAVYLDSWRITPAIRPLKQDVVGDVGNVLWLVMGTIGAVLLIACANVMNLLLVRAEKRRPELAVRAALGAGSWRIMRTLLIESALLGLAGGALGVGLAYGALEIVKRLAPATLPRVDSITLDMRALAFTLVVAAVAGFVLGLIPALRYAGPKINAALRSGGRSGTQGKAQHRTQNALVVAQVALALVLLVSSGLMIRTFGALRDVDPGFSDPQSLQVVSIAIPNVVEPDPVSVVRMQNALLDAIAALPSVSAAGYTTQLPMDGQPNWDAVWVEGQVVELGEAMPMRTYKNLSPGLIDAMGTRLVAGRDLEWTDVYGELPVALVSESLARELWGESSAAVGKRIRPGGNAGPWREVIGVVQDTHDVGLDQPAPAIAYWPPLLRDFFGGVSLAAARNIVIAIRSPLAGQQSFIRQIEQAVWSVNGNLPVAAVRTMQDIYDRSLARAAFTLVMLGIAGAAALVLGVVGLYGVLSYAVSQRRREIAIRLALGAQQRAVTRAFVRYGMTLAGVGVAIGLAGAAAVTRLMSAILYNIPAIDVPTYAVVAIVLTIAAVLASWLPARRAAAVDPAEALAAE